MVRNARRTQKEKDNIIAEARRLKRRWMGGAAKQDRRRRRKKNHRKAAINVGAAKKGRGTFFTRVGGAEMQIGRKRRCKEQARARQGKTMR